MTNAFKESGTGVNTWLVQIQRKGPVVKKPILQPVFDL
jgi:hypothetical protein